MEKKKKKKSHVVLTTILVILLLIAFTAFEFSSSSLFISLENYTSAMAFRAKELCFDFFIEAICLHQIFNRQMHTVTPVMARVGRDVDTLCVLVW